MKHNLLYYKLAVLILVIVFIFIFGMEYGSGFIKIPPYKETHFFNIKVPSTWSVFEGKNFTVNSKEDLLSTEYMALSFSPRVVSISDGAYEQVDFYFITPTLFDEKMKEVKLSGLQTSTGLVGGHKAIIIHYPLDSTGIPNKDFTGGTDYYIQIDNNSIYTQSGNYLYIRNWSKGSDVFDEGIKVFLQSIHF